MSYNPFEESRKNKRISDLVKERDELKELVEECRKAISSEKMINDGLKAALVHYDALKKENKELKDKVSEQFSAGYNQAVWDITHFLTGKQKEIDGNK